MREIFPFRGSGGHSMVSCNDSLDSHDGRFPMAPGSEESSRTQLRWTEKIVFLGCRPCLRAAHVTLSPYKRGVIIEF